MLKIESAGDPSLYFVNEKLIEGHYGLGIFYVQPVVLPNIIADPCVI